jgi:hypothetical protein
MSDELNKDVQVPAVTGGSEKNETTAPTEELTPDALNQVVGGRKAGKGQQEFLVIKQTDVIITGVS